MANMMQRRQPGSSSLRHEMNRLFDNFWNWNDERWPSVRESNFSPAVNAYENEKEFVVEAHVPGFDPEKLDITCTKNSCIIRGEMQDEKEERDGEFFMREASYGSFSRTVDLPEYVDGDNAQADLKNGVLKIHFPKVAGQTARKKIQIRGGSHEPRKVA